MNFEKRAGRSIVLGMFVALASAGAFAAGGCETLTVRAQQLQQTNDARGLQDLFRESSVCSEAQIVYVGQLTAQTLWNALLARAADATDPAPFEKDLKAILGFGQVWQAHELLGDIAAARKDAVAATRAYQAALMVIDDKSFTPAPPAEAEIAALYRKAETQRLLASVYVANTRTRDNRPSGLGAASISRFAVTKTALPVQFQFGKAVFTKEGRAAAEDLFFMLRAQMPEKVTLVGHTDAVGSETANQTLSVARAAAVAAYLKQQGYSGQVEVVGKGESEPFQPDDPAKYSVAEKDQMCRRVELLR